MPDTLTKLRPDRDLQCYFYQPSAVAALSATSPTGFTVSGSWRQQFDWAVIEWNRDNVFEHPALRNLPDGDLSGLKLSYRETQANCIPLDADWYPTVDWPYLRVWAEAGGAEQVYKVRLSDHATAVGGTYGPASALFTLQGTPTALDYIELAWLDEHYTYRLYGADTLESAAQALAAAINDPETGSKTMMAVCTGAEIRLEYSATAGANGNRVGVYANVSGTQTENWQPAWQMLSGGTSPTTWNISIDFSSLKDKDGATVPTSAVRKLRWTWAADVQPGAFARSEFQVVVSNWTVSGANLAYAVAGPGSLRIEDDSSLISYIGQWTPERGNYSGGSIISVATAGAKLACNYSLPQAHQLYLGTRKLDKGAQISVAVDGGAAQGFNLVLDEDVLTRVPLGQFAAGSHRIEVTHMGATGTSFYFNFLEAAVATATLPTFPADMQSTLATDWDTEHSLALAPERTAWMIDTLGFKGRANHYAGALWFFELCRPGQGYATATVTFNGTPEFSVITEVDISGTPFTHRSLIGDSGASVALAFALLINQGSTGVWAEAQGATITVQARAMGSEGNGIAIKVNTNSTQFTANPNDTALASGSDASWLTDLSATPRLNRAARDWHVSFFQALRGYGIEVTAAFSTELQFGDQSMSAGIAQRYPDGTPVMVNTPALQTNFSPASLAFWGQVYLDMANLQAEAGLQPYLQFGEVQWWYFPKKDVGMTFYDAYTTGAFASTYGRPLPVFPDGSASAADYPQECAFLAGLIGSFTDAIMAFVRQTFQAARFEVLYPPDTNAAPLMGAVNLPVANWSPAKLDGFKTENFTYTGDRDLNKATGSVMLPVQLGFAASKSAHLVGIGDYTTPWVKESGIAKGAGVESVVLFALDQFCLIGYAAPVNTGSARSLYMGG